MTLADWLPGASQKAEARKQELSKYVKLEEGKNKVELDLSKEPERVVNKWDASKRRYIYTTSGGKLLEVGEALNFALLDALKKVNSQNSAVVVSIDKRIEEGRISYKVEVLA